MKKFRLENGKEIVDMGRFLLLHNEETDYKGGFLAKSRTVLKKTTAKGRLLYEVTDHPGETTVVLDHGRGDRDWCGYRTTEVNESGHLCHGNHEWAPEGLFDLSATSAYGGGCWDVAVIGRDRYFTGCSGYHLDTQKIPSALTEDNF